MCPMIGTAQLVIGLSRPVLTNDVGLGCDMNVIGCF